MTERKLTKRQREKLIPPWLKVVLLSLPDDPILAVHDFIHVEMKARDDHKRQHKETK